MMGAQYGKGRQSGIDILRLACAVAVMLFHFGFRGYTADGLLDARFPELARVAKYGWAGVEIFFMISGYVIYDSVRMKTVKSFLYGRAVRIFPTLWLCAAITATVVFLLEATRFYIGRHDVPGNLVLWVPFDGYSYQMIDGAYWSLVLELQFYAMVAVVVAALGRDALLPSLSFLVLINLLLKICVPEAAFPERWLCGAYVGFFGIGAALRCLSTRRDMAHSSLLLLVSVVSAVFYTTQKVQYVETHYETWLNGWYVAAILVFGAIILVVDTLYDLVPRSLSSFAAVAGGVTYPLYLLHQNIGYTILNEIFSHRNRWVGLALTVAAVFVLAVAVYYLFDRPVRRYLMTRGSSLRDPVLDRSGKAVRSANSNA
ncbi:acyltransferase [Cupriavidus necator]|uniref:acyltransferase family protein n=1 Tax=Cupriavidus necator TaxID=106590 RepID=UPI00149038D1|nr:acyltransferase [Cupriavidus necator]NOV25879.1 acyltransferase [Cupriavidus necator]